MIVTDRETTNAGNNSHSEPGEVAFPVSPYRPGSRLRQALDLARRPSAAASAPTLSPAAGNVPPRSEPVPPVGPVPSEEPSGEATVTTVLRQTGATPARNKGRGRGLDALLPADPPVDEPAPETWETAAQGWVRTDDGELKWRSIVTTVDRLDRWEVDTYLGLASGQANTGTAGPDSARRAWGQREAVEHMIDDAGARGAHGVIGVRFSLAEGPTGLIVTAVGTAVTLSHRR